ncbi:MAG: hypothetical protein ABI591_33850 [Kofleriaceae bacterium]
MAALFLAGFVANVVNHDLSLGDSIIQWTIAIACVVAFVFVRSQQRARVELGAFLDANRAAVLDGTARYRGQPITYATRLHVYDIVLSFLFVSFKLTSRPVVVGAPGSGKLRAGCTAVTLVFGWWGIPWGPIWTIRAVSRNVRGTKVITIGELYEGVARTAVPAASARLIKR